MALSINDAVALLPASKDAHMLVETPIFYRYKGLSLCTKVKRRGRVSPDQLIRTRSSKSMLKQTTFEQTSKCRCTVSMHVEIP